VEGDLPAQDVLVGHGAGGRPLLLALVQDGAEHGLAGRHVEVVVAVPLQRLERGRDGLRGGGGFAIAIAATMMMTASVAPGRRLSGIPFSSSIGKGQASETG